MHKKQLLPNLNALRVFEAAGRRLSFKDAAEELFVTPSAVSQQIKNLEEQLGVALFKRKNRDLELTARGKEYWQNVHKSINEIYHYTGKFVQANQQVLKVSLMPPMANRVVLPNLSTFHEQHSHIDLRIDSSQKMRNVLTGEVDVAIRFGSPPWEGTEHEKLCDVYVQVVCPAGFTAKYNLAEQPKNITKLPLIQMSQSPEAWESWCKRTGLPIPSGKQHVLDNYPSAIQAAESLGAMLALMPLEAELVNSGRVEAPFNAIGPIEQAIYAVYKAESVKQKEILAFVNWVKTELQNLAFTPPSD